MKQFKWIYNYMSDQDFFTVDMVQHGKPAPDIFLHAAKTKGYDIRDCIVIGDGLSDFNAAKTAKIDFIAFVGAEGNNTPEYRKKCVDAGAYAVCADMKEVNRTLDAWYYAKKEI
jgi:beta-phosphoglucomutase-like phosphatase (HAD superfamily)